MDVKGKRLESARFQTVVQYYSCMEKIKKPQNGPFGTPFYGKSELDPNPSVVMM